MSDARSDSLASKRSNKSAQLVEELRNRFLEEYEINKDEGRIADLKDNQ